VSGWYTTVSPAGVSIPPIRLVSQPSRGQGQALLSCSIPDARSLRGSRDIAAALTDEYARKDAKVWRHALDRLVIKKTLLHLVNNTLAAFAGL
jgi:hypothetical protein